MQQLTKGSSLKHINSSYVSISEGKKPNQKTGRRHFSKEDIEMANKHVKRCLTQFITREMHIKTAKKYHLTPIRMTIIKKCTNNKFWRRYGEKATLFALLVGMQTDIAIMENSKEITLKIRNKSYFCAKLPFSLIMRYVKLIIPSNPTTGHKQ